MTDVHRAFNAPLELYRGVTRTFRIALYQKAAGGETVLGRPTAALELGAAENWTTHPVLIAGLAPAFGVEEPVGLAVEWFTTNPADLTLTVTADDIEAALALLGDGTDRRLVWSVKARPNVSPVADEVLLAHGPVVLYETALRGGMEPL
jgi:hypothetical protein